jgi:hypothetical protein
MLLVSTIIARLLALEDWYLGQFVDVSLVTSASPNECWSFDIVNASVNACGQALLGNATGGWGAMMSIVNLAPTLISALVWGGPFANWAPYIPPTPPPTPFP